MAMYPDRSGNVRKQFRGGGLPPVLPGFYLNGSKSPAFKAAVARVKAGTGRGRIVQKGDSTSAGYGGGSGTSSNGWLGGARSVRPTAVMASLLTSAGINALDTGVVNDNGAWVSNSTGSLPFYDPRTALGSPAWSIGLKNQSYAGGGFLGGGTGTLSLTETGDTCEIVYYNGAVCTYAFTVDGAAPSSGPSTASVTNSGGFTKVTIRAASVGSHVWGISATSGSPYIRSMLVYDSTKPALDFINHSSCSAKSGDQAAVDGTNHWYNMDALAFDAPDLTIINLGLNDLGGNVAQATTVANINAIITKAKLSGDVLLVFPNPAGANYATNMALLDTALQQAAVAAGIPYFSLYQYYGAWTSAFGARQTDGVLHPNAALYAEIAGLQQQALNLMLAL